MKSVLAADIGGTKCRFALVTEDRAIHQARKISTPDDADDFIAAMNTAFEELREVTIEGVDPPSGMGVAIAGLVTPDHRRMTNSSNLPIDGIHLADLLEKVHDLPCSLINDGRASAYGEYVEGHAAGKDPLLVLFFGTGIGTGLIVNGSPYEGAANAAGEIGHTFSWPSGRICPCGEEGHFEAYCGGGPMTERAAQELGSTPAGASRWTVGDIVSAAETRPEARAILTDAEDAACAMTSSLVTLLNPAAIVLGGGVLAGWPELREKITDFIRARCRLAVTQGLEIVPTMAGSDAILWGAAWASGKLWPSQLPGSA